jgi:hypothetical protein
MSEFEANQCIIDRLLNLSRKGLFLFSIYADTNLAIIRDIGI